MSNDILRKLLKIAKNQQKIIVKLAQDVQSDFKAKMEQLLAQANKGLVKGYSIGDATKKTGADGTPLYEVWVVSPIQVPNEDEVFKNFRSIATNYIKSFFNEKDRSDVMKMARCIKINKRT